MTPSRLRPGRSRVFLIALVDSLQIGLDGVVGQASLPLHFGFRRSFLLQLDQRVFVLMEFRRATDLLSLTSSAF